MKIPTNHQCNDCKRLLLNPAQHAADENTPLCGECHARRWPKGPDAALERRDVQVRTSIYRAFTELEAVRANRPELEPEVQAIQLAMIRLNKSLDTRERLARGDR